MKMVGDIETYISSPTVERCNILYDGTKYYVFKNFDEMFIKLTSTPIVCYEIFYHFGGGFDFMFAMNSIIKQYMDWIERLTIIMQGSLAIQINIKFKNRKNIILKDSYALFRCALNPLAIKLLGKGKTLEIDVKTFDSLPDEEVIEYCKNDCKILWDCLSIYQKLLKQPLKLTAASNSLQFFKTHYYKYNLKAIRPPDVYDELKSYAFAGRVDIFKRECKDGVFLDVNNFYPSIMREIGAPVGNVIGVYNKANLERAGFYVIKLTKMPDLHIPFLPLHFDNKLYFLNCMDRYYRVTTYELKLLLKYKMSFKIIEGYEFNIDKTFFSDYIDYWANEIYKDPSIKIIAKLLQNSLSGKFFQNTDNEIIEFGKKDEMCEILNEELNLYKRKTHSNDCFHQPQISAWIWSAARTKLYEYLLKYQQHVCYADTDSLVIPESAIDYNDIDEFKIGKLKIERKFKHGIFLAPKFYGLNDVVEGNTKIDFLYKIKGFDKQCIESNVTFDLFKQSLNIGDAEFEIKKNAMKRLRGVISTNNFVQFKEMTKTAKKMKIKRKLINNIDTVPFKLIGENLI